MSSILTLHDLTASVRGRRRDLGLSQAELARRAGVSRQWLNAFEHGKGTAEIQLVLRLLDALELRVTVEPVTTGRTGGAGRTRSIDLDTLLDEHHEP